MQPRAHAHVLRQLHQPQEKLPSCCSGPSSSIAASGAVGDATVRASSTPSLSTSCSEPDSGIGSPVP
ncbi:MAG: hypothetical protein U0168_06495 [Nannocystaceae bacterium]